LGWTPPPDPSRDELLAELRRLEGAGQEALEHEGWVRLVLPALEADAKLYRTYVYVDGPPLACPIHAYGGAEDANVTAAHLQAWASHTAGAFTCQRFPGGHFFFQIEMQGFLAALSGDLPSTEVDAAS
ncbi:MAG TPA: thioesterase domain-containing protein, partial [Bryobacteraceae bacterium]|nr:thioesterase domain-containing protein [Bryobacteraceae bacterium]